MIRLYGTDPEGPKHAEPRAVLEKIRCPDINEDTWVPDFVEKRGFSVDLIVDEMLMLAQEYAGITQR
jgi:hypothetical protein